MKPRQPDYIKVPNPADTPLRKQHGAFWKMREDVLYSLGVSLFIFH